MMEVSVGGGFLCAVAASVVVAAVVEEVRQERPGAV